MNLSESTLTALKHVGYMVLVGAAGALLTWVAGPGPVELFGKANALFIVPVVTALLSGVVQRFKSR